MILFLPSDDVLLTMAELHLSALNFLSPPLEFSHINIKLFCSSSVRCPRSTDPLRYHNTRCSHDYASTSLFFPLFLLFSRLHLLPSHIYCQTQKIRVLLFLFFILCGGPSRLSTSSAIFSLSCQIHILQYQLP